MNNDILKMGLGTVQFGTEYGISNTLGQTTANEVQQILKVARDSHITLLDTASAYGNAEEVLGMNRLDGFNIVSKFLPRAHNDLLIEQLQKSMSDLGVDNLYGYLAHRPKELIRNPDQWKYLQNFKNKNLVKKIGFSLNSPDELDILLDLDMIPDIVQVPYNYLDRRFEQLMKKLSEEGCEIHTRSAFLQGLLFLDSANLSSYFDQIKPLIDFLHKQINDLPGALLNFVLSKPFIDRVIVGVENSQQLIHNINSLSANAELPELKKKIPNHIIIPSLWPKNQ